MPLYYYQALDATSKRRSGIIEAQEERDARQKLRDQGIMVTHLTTQLKNSSKQQLTGSNLYNFTVQLSQLIGAGIPLYESLSAIEEQSRNEKFHRILLSLCDQIKSGSSLSAAMALFPFSFNKLYCSMIAAGEASGALSLVLEKLSQLIAKQMKIKKQITTAMIYPGILGGFSLLIICLLLAFVIPSIEGIFAEKQINDFTAAILGASRFFRNYFYFYTPAAVLAVIGAVYKLRTPQAKVWLEKISLKIPLIRTMVIQAALARFCRTLATLQQGGLPLIDSLQIARGVIRNVKLEEAIQIAETRIVEGSSLSRELGRNPLIPSLVSRMLAVGEESGTTTALLHKIADLYEEELEKTLDKTMALAQPIILIVMGGVIGIVLIAILLPLSDIGTSINS